MAWVCENGKNVFKVCVGLCKEGGGIVVNS